VRTAAPAPVSAPVSAPASVSARPLWLFGTLWSLRQYPTAQREWTWERKFRAIRDAGFDGVLSPPRPELTRRGDLRYLAVTSLSPGMDIVKPFRAAKDLGAVAIDVQLGDYDSPLAEMVELARTLAAVSRDVGLPFAIETHRRHLYGDARSDGCPGACLPTPDPIQGLPLCLDHSHFAIVRHLAPGTYWERLREPEELLAAAAQFHLRPFNGHHCQIPVLDARGRRTPEYRDWLGYAGSLLHHLRAQPTAEPVLAVPEIGHAAPSYGLSCFSDTWADVCAVERDLRALWRAKVSSPSTP
jgi:hypothetical protein